MSYRGSETARRLIHTQVRDNSDIRRKARDVKMDVKHLTKQNHGCHVNRGEEEQDSTKVRIFTRRGNYLV